MARYTNFFLTGSSQDEINHALVIALEACDLNLIYQDPVCLVAKERPGRVSFTQLATVELLINPPTIAAGGAKVDLVVKNEELPLRRQNHCHEVFLQVNQAIADANAQHDSPREDHKDSAHENPDEHPSDADGDPLNDTKSNIQSNIEGEFQSDVQSNVQNDVQSVVS